MLDSIIDIQSIRQELPGITDHIYLNAATFGPLPRCVSQAMQEWLQKECANGRLGMETYATMAGLYAEARSHCAQLLHADTNEIALTENTGEGLNIVCNGFNWQPGDEVILTNHEHISVLSLLHHIRDRYQVNLRVADLGLGERPAKETIGELITPRTRLIVLSHVTFTNGAILDVQAVAQLAHQSDICVLVDGAQSAGAIPVDVKKLGIDFYAFPMQKWLCGPDGTGALYVRRESLERLHPTYVGWCLLKFEPEWKWSFHDSAQRFELGARQTAAVAGQIASFRWLEETITYNRIFERTCSLSSYAYNALREIEGLTVITPQPGTSGLLTFVLDGYDAEVAAQRLQKEHDIYVRMVHEYNAIRISTGFYNTEQEIDRLAQVLRSWRQKRA
ncbi:aminotransferase class V-fold PLP-dependent enzyme [Dictyobacter aurantiacus]|uniref:Cysteine lyase n=1 Tax=Dictyobacter aurantiacus TaxID=1936993 RepID=A0A401ZLF5_9CHLR|nr:aminotransferase class V-fold PLP-dependent enzyme [Dictyobacter aurantiacus]GCE07685.1 cysteine lyase [Dictyobacter aurantiacus]